MLAITTKVPSVLFAAAMAVGGSMVSCSNSQPPTEKTSLQRQSLEIDPLDAEFAAFADPAKLSVEQRAAVWKHLRHYHLHGASLRRTHKDDLLRRLEEHTRTLVLSELRTDQASVYDQSNLPGAKSSHTPPAH